MNILYSKERNTLTPERVDKLLYIQINRRTLRREGLFRVVEEDEEEDDIIEDADGDTTFARPAYATEAELVEDASVEGSEDELV
jgi:hypothetical protein